MKKVNKETISKTRAFIICSIILLSSIVIIGNFRLLLYSEPFYEHEFSKHNVYSRAIDADSYRDEVLDYLKGWDLENAELAGFNERENSHMLDVKKVIKIVEILLIISTLLMIFSLYFLKKEKETFRKILKRTSITIFSVCIIFLFMALFFQLSFDLFHNLFFEQGTWIFSAEDMLIKLFPTGFFLDYFVMIILNSSIISGILLIISFLLPITGENR